MPQNSCKYALKLKGLDVSLRSMEASSLELGQTPEVDFGCEHQEAQVEMGSTQDIRKFAGAEFKLGYSKLMIRVASWYIFMDVRCGISICIRCDHRVIYKMKYAFLQVSLDLKLNERRRICKLQIPLQSFVHSSFPLTRREKVKQHKGCHHKRGRLGEVRELPKRYRLCDIVQRHHTHSFR